MKSYTKKQLITKLSRSGRKVIIATDHGVGAFLGKLMTFKPICIFSSLSSLLRILLTALCLFY